MWIEGRMREETNPVPRARQAMTTPPLTDCAGSDLRTPVARDNVVREGLFVDPADSELQSNIDKTNTNYSRRRRLDGFSPRSSLQFRLCRRSRVVQLQQQGSIRWKDPYQHTMTEVEVILGRDLDIPQSSTSHHFYPRRKSSDQPRQMGDRSKDREMTWKWHICVPRSRDILTYSHDRTYTRVDLPIWPETEECAVQPRLVCRLDPVTHNSTGREMWDDEKGGD